MSCWFVYSTTGAATSVQHLVEDKVKDCYHVIPKLIELSMLFTMLLVTLLLSSVVGLAVSHSESDQRTSPFTEECVHGKYPPVTEMNVSTYIINLDLPPFHRWDELGKKMSPQISHLITSFLDFIGFWSPGLAKTLHTLVDDKMDEMADTMPYPFCDELKGLSESSLIPLGEIVLYNIFYELFSMCTSIVAENPKGRLYHARNLDFGLFLGWEPDKHSWMVTDALRSLIVQLEFKRQGKTVFKSVNFAGYIGIVTGIKSKLFTLTMNDRFAIDGGYVGILEWILGIRDSRWIGFLTRDVMENATGYEMAKHMLTDTPLLSPTYFILGGNSSRQACVITRSRKKALDVWDLGTRNSSWYILETNYDNWKKALFVDDRRTAAHKCLNKLTQKNIGFPGLFDVLSSRPVLNKLTTYTTLMQVESGAMETYLRHCPDPCPPW